MTYGEGAELAGGAFAEDGQDLGELRGDAQDAGAGLEVAEVLLANVVSGEEDHAKRGQAAEEGSGGTALAAVAQEEGGDDEVLDEDESRLAVRAKGEAVAVVVGQRDQVSDRLEQVRQERHALGRLGAHQLDDLRNLDNGGRADDGDAQTLADAVLDAVDILDVDVHHQRLVALVSDDGQAQVADRTGQVVRDALQEGANRVHGEAMLFQSERERK